MTLQHIEAKTDAGAKRLDEFLKGLERDILHHHPPRTQVPDCVKTRRQSRLYKSEIPTVQP